MNITKYSIMDLFLDFSVIKSEWNYIILEPLVMYLYVGDVLIIYLCVKHKQLLGRNGVFSGTIITKLFTIPEHHILSF